MDKRLQLIAVLALTFSLSTAAPAEWREYQVSARYSGLSAWSLQQDEDYPDRAKLERNLKNGFKTTGNLQVFVSDSYIELNEPGPDWQNGTFQARVHGWNDERYFNAISRLGTVGTKVTLEQHIPLGQRLLLASNNLPHEVFRYLHDKGMSNKERLAEINENGNQKVVVEGDVLADYFLAGDKWNKIAEHRLLPDKSLSIIRLRPNGTTVTQQNWSKPNLLPEKQAPKPLWDRWKIGSSVRDVRIPGLGTPIKWQGPNTGPAPAQSLQSQRTSIKLAWMIPGVLLFVLGMAMVVFSSFGRHKVRQPRD